MHAKRPLTLQASGRYIDNRESRASLLFDLFVVGKLPMATGKAAPAVRRWFEPERNVPYAEFGAVFPHQVIVG